MFIAKNPSELDKPWHLSRTSDPKPIVIPTEITKLLKNFHIMAVEFLYHNYRKGVKGSILNHAENMNYPLQLSAFLSAQVVGPALVLVVCPSQNVIFWQYHLENHAEFDVIQVSTNDSRDTYDGNSRKIALLVSFENLKLCEDLQTHNFFSIVIEDLDKVATKRVIRRLNGSFNVGLTGRSFYTNPDQKLQWNMLNWANPGCVGKLNDFCIADNKSLQLFTNNYRFWWQRLTWEYCESFEKPTDEELNGYKQAVAKWASTKSLQLPPLERKPKRKRRKIEPRSPGEVNGDSKTTISNEAPVEKYVKLPSMDENPIVDSIIKNLASSPEKASTDQTESGNNSEESQSSVIFSILDNLSPKKCGTNAAPSTSTFKSKSEEFILKLFEREDKEIDDTDIGDILKEADSLLRD